MCILSHKQKRNSVSMYMHSYMYACTPVYTHLHTHTHLILFINRLLYFSFQLIVGSEDFDIRVFREDEIIAEMTETEV